MAVQGITVKVSETKVQIGFEHARGQISFTEITRYQACELIEMLLARELAATPKAGSPHVAHTS